MNTIIIMFLVTMLMVTMVMCDDFPVNRMFTVDAGYPRPNLSCVVGFQSIESENLFMTPCVEARNYVVNISREIRKALRWPMDKRALR